MKRFSLHALLSLFLVLSFAACDSADDDDNGNGGGVIGDADVTISGDIEESFSANALFSFDPDDDDFGFGIAIFDGDLTTFNQGKIVAISSDDLDSRLGEGTYDIVFDNDDETEFFAVYGEDIESTTNLTGVVAQSGTLTISSSSSDRLVGSFTFTGTAVSGSAPAGTATVEGTFDAEYIDPDDVPDFETPL